jgi:hypothetical protein
MIIKEPACKQMGVVFKKDSCNFSINSGSYVIAAIAAT